MTVPTQSGTPVTGPPLIPRDANELWVNDVAGRPGGSPTKVRRRAAGVRLSHCLACKVSVTLGAEGACLVLSLSLAHSLIRAAGANKVLKLVSVSQNWIIYTANNGSSTATPSTDARNSMWWRWRRLWHCVSHHFGDAVFMTNWQGTQTFQLNPTTTLAVGGTSDITCNWQNNFWGSDCMTLFSPNYNYIAVRDFVDSLSGPSLRIFNVGTGTLMNSGTVVLEGCWLLLVR